MFTNIAWAQLMAANLLLTSPARAAKARLVHMTEPDAPEWVSLSSLELTFAVALLMCLGVVATARLRERRQTARVGTPRP